MCAGETPGPRSGPPLSYIARATVVVLSVWAVARLAWMARDLLFIVFLAVLASSFFSLFVGPLERRRVPRIAGTALVAIGIVALTVGAGRLAWPTLRAQIVALRDQLPHGIALVRQWVEAAQGIFMNGQPEMVEDVQLDFAAIAERLASGALPIVGTTAGAATAAFVVFFGAVYLTAEAPLFVAGVLRLVPISGRQRARETLDAVSTTLRRWIFGTAINMAIVALATSIGLTLLGIPTALTLGLLAGALEFIPIFGPILAAIPAVVIALILSPVKAVTVALLYIAVQQLQSNLVSPLVMKGMVRLPPALSLFFQALLALLFGFIGLLVAVPLLSAAIVLADKLYLQRTKSS